LSLERKRCITLLVSSPNIGTGFHRTTIAGVRRLVMRVHDSHLPLRFGTRAVIGAARECAEVMTPKNILVPIDFSEHAAHALDYAAALAAQLDARIHLVHAITIPLNGVREMAHSATLIEQAAKETQAALDEVATRYRDRVSMAPVRVEVGDAREVIDQVAEKIGADLIVMGTHGRRGVKRVLLGSVAEAVVRSAPCPVLTVRPKSGT
jgi:nucleotide-binding universal stress UspA family protein